MTPKSLHDHHTARLAWRARRSRIMTDPAMSEFGYRMAPEVTGPFVANQNWEN
jgi:hypothetical protein